MHATKPPECDLQRFFSNVSIPWSAWTAIGFYVFLYFAVTNDFNNFTFFDIGRKRRDADYGQAGMLDDVRGPSPMNAKLL